jgi:lipopolysaccharide transport system ATP-binding protein
MSNIALQVVGVSKRYRIDAGSPMGDAWQSMVMTARRAKRSLFQQPPPLSAPHNDTAHFWALRDIGFDVRHGESVGIIGRNGAGKSTLLKILSRITKPTEGRAEIYGRLGSLLEVGTGFHPELTGRENIFLNATILGLSQDDIRKRFDEIVAFAEIEKFIDTPVKHYSSGMFMRLAFSVSAHLDPDILILDEVLAVGDAAFQKKCLGKMEGVAREGRTVLLVSHSVPQIVSFCDRCILLEEGRLIQDGSAEEVTELYQKGTTPRGDFSAALDDAVRNKTGRAKFTSIKVTPLDSDGKPADVFRVGHDLLIELSILAARRLAEANAGIAILDHAGRRLIDANLALKNDYLTLEAGQESTVRFTLRNLLLRPDTYQIDIWMGSAPLETFDIVLDAAKFTVEVDPRKTRHFQIYPGPYQCEFTHSKAVRTSGS